MNKENFTSNPGNSVVNDAQKEPGKDYGSSNQNPGKGDQTSEVKTVEIMVGGEWRDVPVREVYRGGTTG